MKSGTNDRAVTIVAHRVIAEGGMERAVARLVQGLADRDYEVTVIARACDIAHPRVKWHRIRTPERPFPIGFVSFWLVAGAVLARYKRGIVHSVGAIVPNRVDIATVQFCHHAYAADVRISRASRPSVGFRVNEFVSRRLAKAAERWSYRASRASLAVPVSWGIHRELGRHFPALRTNVPIPNAVDRAIFIPNDRHRRAMRRQVGVAESDLVALFLGGDWARKGLTAAIGALRDAPAWTLVVVGEGDVDQYLGHARKETVEARVRFAGPTSAPEDWYAAADVFVLPTAYEAFPLVSLEAASSGLPLLMPRINGVEDLLEDGVNGWFITREPSSIAGRLRELEDASLRLRMGEAARESTVDYTWDAVVDAYRQTYAEASVGR